MPRNYYEILGLKRDASDEQVAQAYKRLALRWHHKFSKQDQATSFFHFCEISQAYEVLSDPVKRAFYDKYGQEKLKQGFFAEGQLKGGYRFAKNPDQIFQKFFLSNNTFAQVFDKELNNQGSLFSHAFGAQNYKKTNNTNDLVIDLPCTLVELYNGCSKTVSFSRTKVNLDGKTTSEVTQSRQVEIRPGFSKNTIVKVERGGNQTPGDGHVSDLIFKIKEIEHPKFKRLGNDLLYLARINLSAALNAEPVDIVTLDNRKLLVSFDEIINPHTVKQVTSQGMPIQHQGKYTVQDYGRSPQRGNLYIKFSITFPKTLPQSKKIKLRQALSH